MYVIFEKQAEIALAQVLSKSEHSWQLSESDGKTTKVKCKQILLELTDGHAALLTQAQTIADAIDLDFLWECSPENEFHFSSFAREYFGKATSPVQKIALLLALHAAPIYFRRKGQGNFHKAEAAQLQAALAAVARKKQALKEQQDLEACLRQKQIPEVFRTQAIALLLSPNKNSVEYKALNAVATELKLTPLQLLAQLGAIPSLRVLHEARFLSEHFPKGTGFAEFTPITLPDDLELAPVTAFSIDDLSTTEIDDAFSVTKTGDGFRIGIHIAAPGLVIHPGDSVDAIARSRLSTVYCPGKKITMLPDAIVDALSLRAQHTPPVLSLYLSIDAQYQNIQYQSTKIERITIADNLRLQELENWDPLTTVAMGKYQPYQQSLQILWQVAEQLFLMRQEARLAYGLRFETKNRADYHFYLDPERDSNQKIRIEARVRDSPIDRIVSELMIFANSSWATALAQGNLAAIYRVQRHWSNYKTRMQSTPDAHEGLGVTQYTWSTSPLRRYVDLVNQWQIIALVKHGAVAKMFAPFQKSQADLLRIIAIFEATYTEYAQYQNTMECYWCLKWLQQEKKSTVTATVIKNHLARLDELPLVVSVPELMQKNTIRGTSLLLTIVNINEVDLVLEVRLLEIYNCPSETDMISHAAKNI